MLRNLQIHRAHILTPMVPAIQLPETRPQQKLALTENKVQAVAKLVYLHWIYAQMTGNFGRAEKEGKRGQQYQRALRAYLAFGPPGKPGRWLINPE